MISYERGILGQEMLDRIACLYGVPTASWGAVEGGYRNTSYSFVTIDGRKLNFILYKREPGSAMLVQRTNELGQYIRERGLPVRAPVDDRILRVGHRYGSLYAYLPGTTIPWEAYTMKHIKLLGFALARFHAAAEGFTGSLPDVENVYADIHQRMRIYFADINVTEAVCAKLGFAVLLPDIPSLLSEARRWPGRCPLHMDFVRGNLLFAAMPPKSVGSVVHTPPFDREDNLQVGSVSLEGILDLEKAAYGHPVFDLARTLAFLLVDCPKPPEKIYKYFLSSGYEKRGGGNHAYSDAILERLVTMFLLYDFYKFLRQNPYESLSENHHFIRTAAMLKARKVLQ